jgi:hypothetical protein
MHRWLRRTALLAAFGLVLPAHNGVGTLARSMTSAPVPQRNAPPDKPGDLQQCWVSAQGSPACEQHRSRVLELWRAHGSYYALLEIVEARLEPGRGTMRREDVVELLGTQRIDADYPNSRRGGFLVWTSNRLLPTGSRLIVRFDRRGVAQSYEWVSE